MRIFSIPTFIEERYNLGVCMLHFTVMPYMTCLWWLPAPSYAFLTLLLLDMWMQWELIVWCRALKCWTEIDGTYRGINWAPDTIFSSTKDQRKLWRYAQLLTIEFPIPRSNATARVVSSICSHIQKVNTVTRNENQRNISVPRIVS